MVMILVWILQVSASDFGMSTSDSHAEAESEGGSFIWYLFTKAAQIALLGWQAVPFSLCAGGMILRRQEDLLKSRLHSVIFWAPVFSFLAAIALVLLT